MSVPKFSVFTPGRDFKKPSPLKYKSKPENPFRKNKSPRQNKFPVKKSNSSQNYNSAYPRQNICTNCGVQGHPSWKCDQPMSSYGVILLRGDNIDELETVMIMRKDSYDYLTLIKNIDVNPDLLKDIAKGITKLEKQKILTKTFQEMWNELYGHTKYANHKKIYGQCKERFETLGIRSIVYELKDEDLKEYPSWSIPKGKPKFKEPWMDCAFRELYEETGIKRSCVNTVLQKPVYHLRTGSDGKSYIGVYYIALVNKEESQRIEFKAQPTEVQSIGWKSLKILKKNMNNFPVSEIKKQLNENNFY